MKTRHGIALFFLAVPYVACGSDTEEYFAKDDAMIPIDWASQSPTNDSNIFESFSGKEFFFYVREGYESEIISLGTPIQTATSTQMSATATTMSEASMGDAVVLSTPDTPTTSILGPYVDAGVTSYNVKTGIDTGVYCSEGTAIQVDPETQPQLFKFICTDNMKTQ